MHSTTNNNSGYVGQCTQWNLMVNQQHASTEQNFIYRNFFNYNYNSANTLEVQVQSPDK